MKYDSRSIQVDTGSNGGTLTIEDNVHINNLTTTSSPLYVFDGGKVYMNGGTISYNTIKPSASTTTSGASATSYGVVYLWYRSNGDRSSSVTMSGDVIVGIGTANISGGTIKS